MIERFSNQLEENVPLIIICVMIYQDMLQIYFGWITQQ
jgi:hypothetical protein